MNKKLKIAIISDTHGMHKGVENRFKFPPADFIIHCGDISGRGTEKVIREFLYWFNNLDQFKHKIFIAGNHDILFEDYSLQAKEIVEEFENVIYLEDNGIELEGIKLWGTPVTRSFNNWAFNRSEEKLQQHWEAIPDDTDVVITHGPPKYIMDFVDNFLGQKYTGSPSLYNEIIDRIKPQINCFGHIHENYGQKYIKGVNFINASVLNDQYRIVNPPIYVDIEVE